MGNLLLIFHFSLLIFHFSFLIFHFLLLTFHSSFLILNPFSSLKKPRSTHGNAAALRASMGASWYMYV